MKNVTIYDNGNAFCVMVDGLIVDAFSTLGAAWNRIAWMYRIASQEFVVGDKEVPVKEWIEAGIKNGFLDDNAGMKK